VRRPPIPILPALERAPDLKGILRLQRRCAALPLRMTTLAMSILGYPPPSGVALLSMTVGPVCSAALRSG
jgi:hypothetical protein